MESFVFNIHALKRFILSVEMEQKLYKETMKSLMREAKSIRDKYKHSLEIEEFLHKYLQMQSSEERMAYHEEFKKKKINETLCYGDVFSLREENNDSNRIGYSLKINKINADYYRHGKGSEKIYQISEAIKSAGEKVISGAIQTFEKCFENLLYYLIKSKPDAYLHDKSIPYSDIISQDIEELKEKILDDEVKKLMYGVSDTIIKINNIHNMRLERYQDIWDSYIEMDLHRNIIMHNDGVVNSEYLKKVPSRFKNVKENDYISCDAKCITEKVNNLIKFAFLLFYLVGKSERDLDELSSTAFDLLKNENWDSAEYAYLLLLKVPTISHSSKLMYQINYLNAKKHKFGIENTRDEIDELDVTCMEKQFEVAKNLLLDNYDTIEEDLELCYPNYFDSYSIHTWPIFIEFRKTEYYQHFREKHQEDFEQYDFSSNTDE